VAQGWLGRVTVSNPDFGIKTPYADVTSVTTGHAGQLLTFTKDNANRWYVTGLDALTNTVSALPTASADYRGQTRMVVGGTGVADVFYVCRKNAADGYEWVALH
jgi:hypothetical protein